MSGNAETREVLETGLEQVYVEIKNSLDLILRAEIPGQPEAITAILASLDDAITNNWDELTSTFLRNAGLREFDGGDGA